MTNPDHRKCNLGLVGTGSVVPRLLFVPQIWEIFKHLLALQAGEGEGEGDGRVCLAAALGGGDMFEWSYSDDSDDDDDTELGYGEGDNASGERQRQAFGLGESYWGVLCCSMPRARATALGCTALSAELRGCVLRRFWRPSAPRVVSSYSVENSAWQDVPCSKAMPP